MFLWADSQEFPQATMILTPGYFFLENKWKIQPKDIPSCLIEPGILVLFTQQLEILGRFPFVRTDRPNHSQRNENFHFNQISPARSVKSWVLFTKEMVVQQKLLEKAYFIIKPTGRAMVRPASSDKWKAPLVTVLPKFISF